LSWFKVFHEGFDFILGDFEVFEVLNWVFVDGPEDSCCNNNKGVDLPPAIFSDHISGYI